MRIHVSVTIGYASGPDGSGTYARRLSGNSASASAAADAPAVGPTMRPARFSSRATLSPVFRANSKLTYPIEPTDSLIRPATPSLPTARIELPGQLTSVAGPNRD